MQTFSELSLFFCILHGHLLFFLYSFTINSSTFKEKLSLLYTCEIEKTVVE